MIRIFSAICAFALLAPVPPARAADGPANCVAAYDAVAQDYWVIVNDMLQFRAMFDHYDRICSAGFPDQIAATQPVADTLRAQVKRDIDDSKTVMTRLFDEKFSAMVVKECADDTRARDKSRNAFLDNMKTKAAITEKRLDKSREADIDAADISAAKLCGDLKPMKVKVEKHLSPGLENPLLEMATLHSSLIRHAPKQRKKAFALYRAMLGDVRAGQAAP